ncbi:CPBP family intramembrane glutamic endopeptidase [Hyphococcus sp.]|uniref:CPBP family intramembrane glutamic endopeptidase n=1 Tax=Hyphococcus sp. TaxID=2038636 RepID=UPI00208B3325|nr:MAG: abortive infection protein [Marinicaulis sp.]
MKQETPTTSDQRAFNIVIAGTAAMGLAAIGFSFLLSTPLMPQFKADFNAILIGVIATAPLVGFLYWFSNTTLNRFASFRRSQIKFFSEIGFAFTPPRIAAMAIGAGIAEELLFRGVLQSWIGNFAPAVIAIVISNMLFGMMHMRTLLYAIIAGLVGAYLGILYALTDNLLAPMVTHAIYDAVALEYTRRAINRYKSGFI